MNNLEEKIYMTEGAYATSYKEIENEILSRVSTLFTEDSVELSIDISNDGAAVTLFDRFTGEPVNLTVNRVIFKRGVKKLFIEGVAEDGDRKSEVSDLPVWQQGFILLPLVRRIEKLEAEKKATPKQYTTIRVSVNLEFDGALTDEELEKKLCSLLYAFKDEDDKEISSGDMDWDVSEKRYLTY